MFLEKFSIGVWNLDSINSENGFFVLKVKKFARNNNNLIIPVSESKFNYLQNHELNSEFQIKLFFFIDWIRNKGFHSNGSVVKIMSFSFLLHYFRCAYKLFFDGKQLLFSVWAFELFSHHYAKQGKEKLSSPMSVQDGKKVKFTRKSKRFFLSNRAKNASFAKFFVSCDLRGL